MKLKSALKYQLRGFWCVPVLYLGFCLLVIALGITYQLNSSANSGTEYTPWGAMLVTGSILFKTSFKLFSVNGVSRKTLFHSLAIVIGIVAVTMSLINVLNTMLYSCFTNYHSLFARLYYGSMLTDSHSTQYTFQMLAQQFLWQGLGYLLVALVGLFISALYYRMNRAVKIAVSISVPAFCACVFPILDFALWGGRVTQALQAFFNFALGYSNGYNPYIGMASMFIFAAVTALLAWLAVRRTNVKA